VASGNSEVAIGEGEVASGGDHRQHADDAVEAMLSRGTNIDAAPTSAICADGGEGDGGAASAALGPLPTASPSLPRDGAAASPRPADGSPATTSSGATDTSSASLALSLASAGSPTTDTPARNLALDSHIDWHSPLLAVSPATPAVILPPHSPAPAGDERVERGDECGVDASQPVRVPWGGGDDVPAATVGASMLLPAPASAGGL